MTILCQKRIKIEGAPNLETYCMQPLDHEGECDKAVLARSEARPTLKAQAEELYGARR